jgi:hypothetical protein
MNETALRKSGKSEKTKLVELIKEYIDRLYDLKERAEKSHTTKRESKVSAEELSLLGQHFRKLQPPVRELVRYTSQMIEHGSADELARLELRLRLADLEHALTAADRIIAIARSS